MKVTFKSDFKTLSSLLCDYFLDAHTQSEFKLVQTVFNVFCAQKVNCYGKMQRLWIIINARCAKQQTQWNTGKPSDEMMDQPSSNHV